LRELFSKAEEIFAGIANALDGKLSYSDCLKTGKLKRVQYNWYLLQFCQLLLDLQYSFAHLLESLPCLSNLLNGQILYHLQLISLASSHGRRLSWQFVLVRPSTAVILSSVKSKVYK